MNEEHWKTCSRAHSCLVADTAENSGTESSGREYASISISANYETVTVSAPNETISSDLTSDPHL
jgi:hypothetical protein